MLLLYIKIDIQSVQSFRDFMFLNRRAAEIAVKAVRKVGGAAVQGGKLGGQVMEGLADIKRKLPRNHSGQLSLAI